MHIFLFVLFIIVMLLCNNLYFKQSEDYKSIPDYFTSEKIKNLSTKIWIIIPMVLLSFGALYINAILPHDGLSFYMQIFAEVNAFVTSILFVLITILRSMLCKKIAIKKYTADVLAQAALWRQKTKELTHPHTQSH